MAWGHRVCPWPPSVRFFLVGRQRTNSKAEAVVQTRPDRGPAAPPPALGGPAAVAAAAVAAGGGVGGATPPPPATTCDASAASRRVVRAASRSRASARGVDSVLLGHGWLMVNRVRLASAAALTAAEAGVGGGRHPGGRRPRQRRRRNRRRRHHRHLHRRGCHRCHCLCFHRACRRHPCGRPPPHPLAHLHGVPPRRSASPGPVSRPASRPFWPPLQVTARMGASTTATISPPLPQRRGHPHAVARGDGRGSPARAPRTLGRRRLPARPSMAGNGRVDVPVTGGGGAADDGGDSGNIRHGLSVAIQHVAGGGSPGMEGQDARPLCGRPGRQTPPPTWKSAAVGRLNASPFGHRSSRSKGAPSPMRPRPPQQRYAPTLPTPRRRCPAPRTSTSFWHPDVVSLPPTRRPAARRRGSEPHAPSVAPLARPGRRRGRHRGRRDGDGRNGGRVVSGKPTPHSIDCIHTWRLYHSTQLIEICPLKLHRSSRIG